MVDPPPLAFIATSDLTGLVRGRSVPGEQLAAARRVGVGWVPADLALTSFGTIAPNVFGATGDLRLMPDPATAIELPPREGSPGVALILSDQVEPDGRPWCCCPRTFARRALDELGEVAGLAVRASFEHEFMLPDLGSSPPFSFGRHRSAEPFGTDLVRLVHDVGLEPETWLPEFGAEQFEITLRPSAGLVAADRALILREVVREVAQRHGQRVTFAPLTDPEGSGNGVHVHLSLVDRHDRPALYDPARPAGLSEIGSQFAAGILAHAPALLPFTAASPVSYLRLAPHRWSAGGIFLGERNREALLRISPVSAIDDRDPGPQYNLEFRAADATANPWLVIGVLVRAGLEGIRNGYKAPTIWPESVTEAELVNVQRLPVGLAAALERLRADEVVSRWFHDDLIHTFHAVKQAEIDQVNGLDDLDICRRAARVY